MRLRIEKLARHHDVDSFDCGDDALNRYLIRFALPNQQANASQTYLGLADDRVIGLYTLVVGEVAFADAPERLTKGLARFPVPIMLLARMGVALDWQGKGAGAGLLKDAMRRTMQAAQIAGIRAFVVHAKNDRAAAFYQRHGLIQSPTDPLHYYVLVKELPGMSGDSG